MLQELFLLLSTYWILLPLVVAVCYLVKQKFHNGLHAYPGPFLAAYTDLWRLFATWSGRRMEHKQLALHDKFGDVVRLGPNLLSFSDPTALKDIYSLNLGFTKSAYYPVSTATSHGRIVYSLFSTRDEAYHARLRRCVNHAFAMTSLKAAEPLIDSTIAAFLAQTDALFARPRAVCSLAEWFQFFAFDVVGELTWSTRLGFVERNADVEGIIAAATRFTEYGSVVGQAPWLDRVWAKNPLRMFLARRGLWPDTAASPILRFALARQAEHTTARTTSHDSSTDPRAHAPTDLLTAILAAQKTHASFLTDARALGVCTSLIVAGSDTTATTLAALFNYTLRHPAVHARLVAEIDAHAAAGPDILPYDTAKQLPYLAAVISETFRLHPAIGLLLERVVPRGGAVVAGRHVPGGTVVGCNAHVVHRCARVFGDDARAFRPERWLDGDRKGASDADGKGASDSDYTGASDTKGASDGDGGDRLKAMRAALFHFGGGSRTCIGRNISLLEIYKLVPAVLRRFEVRLADPMRQARSENAFFVRLLDLPVLFARRGAAAGGDHDGGVQT